MINLIKQTDGSWLVKIEKNGYTTELYFCGGNRREIMKAAKQELARI
jgi:hypothetical protein